MTPKLRFPEFTDEWQVKKLGETLEIDNGYPFSSAYFNTIKNGKPLIRIRDLKAKKLKTYYSGAFDVRYLVQDNNVLIGMDGEFNITRWNLGLALLNQRVMRIRSKQPHSLIYLSYLLETKLEDIERKTPKTTVKHLSSKDIINIFSPIPNKAEQEKIADFLTAVDDRAAAMQQKVELLKKYKKGVMQKIFTQQIRFKGENGNPYPAWEDKVLGDTIKVSMGQSPDSRAYNNDGKGLYLLQGNADIKGRRTAPRFWTNQITKTCEVGDILLTVRAPSGYVAISNHHACIGRGVSAITPKESIIKNYLFQFLLWFEPKWGNIEQGSTFMAISGDDIRSVKLSLPSLSEQQRIADFLTAIDEKLELLGRELEQARKFKKALLQQMLV